MVSQGRGPVEHRRLTPPVIDMPGSRTSQRKFSSDLIAASGLKVIAQQNASASEGVGVLGAGEAERGGELGAQAVTAEGALDDGGGPVGHEPATVPGLQNLLVAAHDLGTELALNRRKHISDN